MTTPDKISLPGVGKNRYKFIESEHLHTLDGRPLIGTSTALKVLAKPLTWWASGLAVAELGWMNPKKVDQNTRIENVRPYLEKIKGYDPVEYLRLLDKAYKAHATILDKSAEEGTDMHAELEKYVRWCIGNHEGKIPKSMQYLSEYPAVQIFMKWAKENVEEFLISEGHCYSETLWTGGIVDLLYKDKKGMLVVLDFKSSKEAYLSQFFQDAGYDIAISESGILDAEGNLLYKPERSVDYYGVFPFGMENPEPKFHFDTEGAREGFIASVKLHKLINTNG